MASEAKRVASPESTSEDDELTGYTPRTPLGARLLELRRRIIRSGAPLLDWEGLEREVAQRRGAGKPIHRVPGIFVQTIHTAPRR